MEKTEESKFELRERYFNRELSWLDFNFRVLEEAFEIRNPLLERLKFLCIFTMNFDEFCMVRVAGLKKMLKEGFSNCESPDHLPIDEVLRKVTEKSRVLKQSHANFFSDKFSKEMKDSGLEIISYNELNGSEKKKLDEYFELELFPVLTPLAVDSSHPYPYLNNLSLYLLVEFVPDPQVCLNNQMIGFVEVPNVIPRLISLEENSENCFRFVLLEDLIKAHLNHLFLGFEAKKCYEIRVIRNLDYKLLENDVVDLLETIQKEMNKKHQQEVVWIETNENMPLNLKNELKKLLKITEDDIFTLRSPLYLPGLLSLYDLPLKNLKDPAFNPRLPSRLEGNKNIFSLIRVSDLLVHHPYESFYAVIEFLNSAAEDPSVLAIKQTLYRTSGDSPIIDSLIRAAENGKQVTAVMELKARFDETNNILWARRLERAGVNVVFGFVGFKTHCKFALVIRREKDKLRRYVHLSTGNYNSHTAKMYTDIGLFSSKIELTEEISALFNLLTGFNVLVSENREKTSRYSKLFSSLGVAPLTLRPKIIREIDLLIKEQKEVGSCQIMAKMNGLVDQQIIEKLYDASNAGG